MEDGFVRLCIYDIAPIEPGAIVHGKIYKIEGDKAIFLENVEHVRTQDECDELLADDIVSREMIKQAVKSSAAAVIEAYNRKAA